MIDVVFVFGIDIEEDGFAELVDGGLGCAFYLHGSEAEGVRADGAQFLLQCPDRRALGRADQLFFGDQ